MSKARTLERQRLREEKDKEDIKSGRVIRVHYEERKKKKAQPNRKSSAATVEEEMSMRQETVEKTAVIYRRMLPGLLQKLSKIKDPRQPAKVKHKMTVLMIYGILLFVYHTGSRRNANKDMTNPIFMSNIRMIFPEFESIPHADTLARFLERIDVEKIQDAMTELLKELMRKKKFKNLFINRKYLIAVDGTQKFFRNYQWQKEALERNVGEDPQYYVYALDSVLVLDNGMVLPVLTEILDNEDWIKGQTKQDCESKAFKRLAPKLKKIFGKGKVIILGDGLYACGPVIKTCRNYNWDFMLVLKEDGSRSIWREATGLMRLEPDNRLEVCWGDRNQLYHWANDIEYEFSVGRRRYTEEIHVVICYERWEEYHSRSTGKLESKKTRYAWISSKRITDKNVFMRCTKMARYRWKIENNFLIEKHEGYFFEHCYSYNWKAMKGFHYLMKIGHFLNVMVTNSEIITSYVGELGIRGFISFLRKSLEGAVLEPINFEKINRYPIWKLKMG